MRITRANAKVLGISVNPASATKATKPSADAMNGLERRYSEHLEERRNAGEIWRWDFQPIKLRLADLTWYCPDFRVILADGTEQMHETKGHWEDDARVKIKVAAEQHPYPFIAVRWVKKQWVFERFEAKLR